jgi:hypothetical protein
MSYLEQLSSPSLPSQKVSSDNKITDVPQVKAVFHTFLTSEIIGGKAASSLADNFHIWVKSASWGREKCQ